MNITRKKRVWLLTSLDAHYSYEDKYYLSGLSAVTVLQCLARTAVGVISGQLVENGVLQVKSSLAGMK